MPHLPDGRRYDWRALHYDVLVVAVQGGHGGDWAAYVKAVPGENHDREWEEVYHHGGKLPENVAKLLFPGFKDLEYRW